VPKIIIYENIMTFDKVVAKIISVNIFLPHSVVYLQIFKIA